MAKYQKQPVVIEAVQWFKQGDHPAVEPYANPAVEGVACQECGKPLEEHGYVMTLESGHLACSGDWIITGVKGEHYPCKPDVFEATYTPAPEDDPGKDGQGVSDLQDHLITVLPTEYVMGAARMLHKAGFRRMPGHLAEGDVA